MSRLPLLLCCALLGLAPGCAKRADHESSAPSPESAMGGGSDRSMTNADMGPPPSPAPMPAYDDGDYASKATGDAEARDEMTPTAVQAAPTRGAPTGGVAAEPTGKLAEPRPVTGEAREGKGAAAGEDDRKTYARQIIYTAEMQISVYKLDDAMARAEELTLAAGGYVQNLAQGYYVLRIPAPALRGVMDELARLGVVEARTLQARDVTEEYVDLTTRIRVLRETQAQLLTLLKQARNVDETLKVRESLDQITMQLEQATGRLRMLESLIGFSTLTVRMSQRGPQNTIPSSNDPFPWVDGLGVEATEWN